MAVINLGRVAPFPRGQHSALTEYNYFDLVTDNGSSYLYINKSPSTGTPLSSTTHWQQIAAQGLKGDTGDVTPAAIAARDTAIAQAALAQGYAAQLAAGTASPAGTYANLAALNSGTPTAPNTAKIYITLDDGKWCYHNGSVWVAGGAYQAASLAASAVTTPKTGVSVQDKIDEHEDTIFEVGEMTIADLTFVSGKYLTVAGVETSHTTQFRLTGYVPVKAGDSIPYSLYGYNNVICVIAAYNASNAYQSAASVFYKAGVSSGVGYRFEGTYVVPDGITQIRVGTYGTMQFSADAISIPKKISTPAKNADRIGLIEQSMSALGIENQWKDKKWTCFGTSLTDNWSPNAHIGSTEEPSGKYPPFLAEIGEFIPFPDPHPAQPDISASNNLGIAGGRISGQVLYYIRYFLRDNPNGPAHRPTNADLITIEGSVNDFAAEVPLGDVGDTVPYTDGSGQGTLLPDATGEGSFAGACYCAFKEAMEYAPNATVVFLTDTTGKYYSANGNDYGQSKVNGIGLRQIDYINMAAAVAKYVGIPVIECGAESMINASNPQYIADWIHHSYLGGYQYAKTIWGRLKNIPLKAISLPTP